VGNLDDRDVAVFDFWLARSGDASVNDYEYYTCAVTPVPDTWPRISISRERIETRLFELYEDSDIAQQIGAVFADLNRLIQEGAFRPVQVLIDVVVGGAVTGIDQPTDKTTSVPIANEQIPEVRVSGYCTSFTPRV
jgi:hypothetical protein